MGGACSTYLRVEAHTGFQWESPREEDHFKEPGIDGRIILKRILEKWVVVGMNWINLAKDMDRWWALVEVMNLRVP
jgi:hypothetical protein